MTKLKIGKKSGLKYFGIKDIRSWNPCYDPSRYLKEDWRGTAVDMLNIKKIPFKDRVWVILRPELISERTMLLFAVWCYRDTLTCRKNPDPRSIQAANVAERFSNGQATREELMVAMEAAEKAEETVQAEGMDGELAAQERQKQKLIEMIKVEAKAGAA